MKNTKYINQMRNNYYHGKLLTEKDFIKDQEYFNNKRRLINKMIFGSGIVKGLEVIRLDRENMCVEPGMAIDYYGRELVVDSPLVFKLEDIENFNKSEDYQDALLYLEYEEFLENKFDSVGEFEGKNGNTIIEGTRLGICKYDDFYIEATVNNYIYNYETIYRGNGVEVILKAPKFIKKGKYGLLSIIVNKSADDIDVDIKINIGLKYLYSTEGLVKELVKFKPSGLHHVENYYVLSESTANIEGEIYIDSADTEISINDHKYGIDEGNNAKVRVIENDYYNEVMRKYDSVGILEIMESDNKNKVFLSRINAVKEEGGLNLRLVANNPFNQRILNLELLNLLSKKTNGDTDFNKEKSKLVQEVAREDGKEEKNKFMSNSGEFKVDLTISPKKNKVYYSPEISHDLGMGIVDIKVGHKRIDGEEECIVYGRLNEYKSKVPDFETSVLLYPKKGTFKLAVYLMGNSRVKELDFTWHGIKVDKKVSDVLKDPNVVINPDSVIVLPKAEMVFKGRIENYENQELIWRVVDSDGGIISENGYYIAPDKIGVYKIEAYSIKNHNIKGTSYVVVKR